MFSLPQQVRSEGLVKQAQAQQMGDWGRGSELNIVLATSPSFGWSL